MLDDFKARFPGFPVAVADVYVPIVEPVYPDYYAFPYEAPNVETILQLVAHLVVTESDDSDDPYNPVASKAVGPESTSYAVNAPTDDRDAFFMTTKYGQRFLRLTAHRHGAFAV